MLEQRAKELAEKADGQAKGTADLDLALADDRVKAVLIATPTEFHYKAILASVRV